MEDLRALTSMELFLNSGYYAQHPCFVAAAEDPQLGKTNPNNLLAMSVSFESVDSGLLGSDLVRKEAILNCYDKQWCSFLTILGLSSVIQRNIFVCYPDSGEHRYKLLFNRLVKPREPLSLTTEASASDLYILFCFEGIVKAGDTFKPNHFVPLIFIDKGKKRKHATLISAATKSKKPKLKVTMKKPVLPKISSFFQPSLPNKLVLPKPVSTASSVSVECTSINTKTSFSHTLTHTTPPLCPTTSHINLPAIDFDNVNQYDIALYRERVKGMNKLEIENLIKNVFKPDKIFVFPKTGKRCFRYVWLERYPWLCYSPSTDGAYCLPCV